MDTVPNFIPESISGDRRDNNAILHVIEPLSSFIYGFAGSRLDRAFSVVWLSPS
jgi:hypothetical protein